jgi:ketosteroid isomerase-like protein
LETIVDANPAMILSAHDEHEIRALVARYLEAVSRFDATTLATTWATDGQWHLGPRTVVGRAAIVELWKQIIARYESRLIQLMVDAQVQAAPGGATGRFTFLEIARKAGEGKDHVEVGRYSDAFARENGQWVFAERRFTLLYRGWIAAGEFFPVPATGQQAAGDGPIAS